MVLLLIDALLVLALLALVAAAGRQILSHTPLGLRWQQIQNRRRIERQASLVCPLHGVQAAQELVRLPSGETICPLCYEEVHHADPL